MKRVLTVDDDKTCQRLLEKFIKKAGFEPILCQNGAEAWERFQQDDFGVVITDYEMPLLNGLELLERIKKNKPDIPVIIFTGAKDTRLKKQAWDLGVFDFLFKPLDYDYLSHTLRAAYTFGLPDKLKNQKKHKTPDPTLTTRKNKEDLFANLIEAIGYEAVLETTQEFYTQSKEDIQLLQNSIGQFEPHPEISKVAHRLKGAAASLGLEKLAQSCEELESINKNHKSAMELLERLIQKDLEAALQSLQTKLASFEKSA